MLSRSELLLPETNIFHPFLVDFNGVSFSAGSPWLERIVEPVKPCYQTDIRDGKIEGAQNCEQQE